MLTIPIERIALILNRASEVEPADVIESEVQAEAETEETGGESAEDAFATPAQRSLIAVLETFNPDELYELLALAEMAGFDGAPGSWESAMQRAQTTAADNAVEHLVRILVLSDAVEVGLERLGYARAECKVERATTGTQAKPPAKTVAPTTKPKAHAAAAAKPKTKAKRPARRRRRH